jgi:hypothetical protein
MKSENQNNIITDTARRKSINEVADSGISTPCNCKLVESKLYDTHFSANKFNTSCNKLD